jgi:hypothetical protein
MFIRLVYLFMFHYILIYFYASVHQIASRKSKSKMIISVLSVIHLDDDVSVNQNHLFQATNTILSSVTSATEELIVGNCLQNLEDDDIPPNSGNVVFCLCNFIFVLLISYWMNVNSHRKIILVER